MKIHRLTPKRDRKRRFMRVNVLASAMTTMNLYMGVTSILASIGLEFQWAAACILIAIVFDMLDGFVARITRSVSDFGKELDSLCDMVSFGVAPGILVFMAYLPPDAHLPMSARAESIVGMTGSYMAVIYVICAALRLARFNTFHAEMRDSFIGLPSPAAGGSLAAFVLFLMYFEERLEAHALGSLAYVALGPSAVLLAFLMVSSVRYPKNRFKTFLLQPRHAFVTLAVVAFLLGAAHYALVKSVSLVLFPLAAAYVFFGIADTVYGRLSGREPSYATVSEEELCGVEASAEAGEDDGEANSASL